MEKLNKHIKCDKAKWVITSVVALLIILTIVGMCLQLFGQGKTKPSEWFKQSPVESGETANVEQTSNLYAVEVAPMMSSGKLRLASSGTGTFTSIKEDTRKIDPNNYSGSLPLLDKFTSGDYDSYDNAEYRLSIKGLLDEPQRFLFAFDEVSIGYHDGLNGIAFAIKYRDTYIFYDDTQIREEIINPEFILSYNNRIDEINLFLGGYNLNDYIVENCDFNTIRDYFIAGLVSGNFVFDEFFNDSDRYEVVEKVVYEATQSLPPAPTKEGYTFTGWYFDEACTRKYNGEPITSDTALYAGWQINKYTVTFNSDGGSAVASQSVDYNTSVKTSTPTKEGYTFKGWYLSNGTQYTNQPIKADTTLTAKWQINKHTVSFNSDGGSAVENKTVDWNTAVQCPTPTKEGYIFKGWFLPNGTQYTNQPIKADTTLKAKWEIKKLSVVFDTDGGNVIADQTIEYGKPATLATPVREGYDFKGWFLPNGTEYTNQAIKENTTLKATWEIKHFTVTFYVDGVVYNEMTVDYGTRLTEVADRAQVYSQNILSYSFKDENLAVEESGEMIVVGDMDVEANAPTENDKVVGTIKNNWLPIVLGCVGLVLLIALISVVATRRKRR